MSTLIRLPASVTAYAALRNSPTGRVSPDQLSALKARAEKDWKDALPKDFYIALRVYSVYVFDVYGSGITEEGGMQALYMGGYMIDARGNVDKHVPGEFNTTQGGTYRFEGGNGTIMLKVKNPTDFVDYQLFLAEDDKKARDAATALKGALSSNGFDKAADNVAKVASAGNPVAGALGALATVAVGAVIDLLAKNKDDYMGMIRGTEFADDFFGTAKGVITQNTNYATIKYRLELRSV